MIGDAELDSKAYLGCVRLQPSEDAGNACKGQNKLPKTLCGREKYAVLGETPALPAPPGAK